MKKCFIGITIVGCLSLVTIIIVIAAAGSSKEVTCPPYHYRDVDADVGDSYLEEDEALKNTERI